MLESQGITFRKFYISQDLTFRKIQKREKNNLAKCNIWPNGKSCEMAKSFQKA